MKEENVYIKNMVCPRCIETVRGIFDSLHVAVIQIRLGEVTLSESIPEAKKNNLQELLIANGFELLEDNKSRMIGKIKSLIIEQVHHSDKPLDVNFSTLISSALNHDYSSLSRLFSSVEGITIEKFVLSQKIEKVKELLFYDELTLSEISYKMNYSSVAYLSSQFKRETGMTPTEFKRQRKPDHKSLDEI